MEAIHAKASVFMFFIDHRCRIYCLDRSPPTTKLSRPWPHIFQGYQRPSNLGSFFLQISPHHPRSLLWDIVGIGGPRHQTARALFPVIEAGGGNVERLALSGISNRFDCLRSI